MKPIICTLLFFVLTSYSSLWAQWNFTAGQIITAEGQSIDGFIRKAPFSELRNGIFFKKTLKEKQSTPINADEIKGFTFANGDAFVAHPLPVISKEFINDESKALYHLLVDGPVQLFELNGQSTSPLFLKKGSGPLIMLCLSAIPTEGFRSVLYQALDKTISEKDLKSVPLKRKPIQRLIENFNQGTPLSSVGYKAIPFPRMSIGGFLNNQVIFDRNQYKGLGNGLVFEVAPLPFKRFTISAKIQQLSASTSSALTIGEDRFKREHRLESQNWSVRGNYYFLKKGWASPYVFAGYQKTNAALTIDTYFEEVVPEAKVETNLKPIESEGLLLGTGLAFFYKRHALRLELSTSKIDLSFRLGYQFALWN